MGRPARTRGARRTPVRAALARVPVLALGPAVGLVLGGAGPAHAAPEDLRLVGPRLSADRLLTVNATVPAALSGQELPAEAFAASQAGAPVPVTATRVLGGPVPPEVVLLLDTTVRPDELAAEQAAAADLLRALPAQTPVTVLPGGDRTTAISALASVAALPVTGADLLSDLPPPPSVRRFVVVLSGCAAVGAEGRSIPGDDTQVSVLTLGPGCEAAGSRLAGRQPGVVRSGLDAAGLLAATDDVARELLGQYALRSEGPVGEGAVEVSVRSGTTSATASVDLTAQQLAAASSAGTDVPADDLPAWVAVLATTLAVLAGGGLAAELLSRRRAA